jgi:hypothetical protein
MKNILPVITFITVTICASCNSGETQKNYDNECKKSELNNGDHTNIISRDSILKIAEANAKTAYRDLSIYTVKAELKDEKWYVDYEITDPQMTGGGPHYIISARTGIIDSCRYEQ